MKDGISVISSALKCDNPECDFRDDSVTFADIDNWVEKPCPKCGAILLTKEDYLAVKALHTTVNITNELCKELGIDTGGEKYKIETAMNGTGKIELNISNENKEP